MKDNKKAHEHLKKLKGKYIYKVRKFIEALTRNRPQNELMAIRKITRQLFQEIRKKSLNNDPKMNSQ